MYANDDVQYAAARLIETIITYKGEAVEVYNVKNGGKELQVFAEAILTGETFSDDISEYDLTPVKLGFINDHNYGLLYLSRMPMRADWRQGLRSKNSCVLWGAEEYGRKALAMTIEGRYPSLEECRKDKDTQAWNREFATNKEGTIFYRHFGAIGNFVGDTKEYLLDGQFFWVEESLREALV